MTTFPILTNDVELRTAVADRDEIRFMKQSNGTTVCSYIVASADTFRCNFSREARGVVFDENGKTIARPLHKFFNVNERPETQASQIDWTQVTRVMLKRDGSMIHTVALTEDGRNFTVKSKKSFESDVAVQSKKWLLQRENFVRFCTEMTDLGLTAIFEWTSPTARIVVGYKQEELQLLHVRENESGKYLTREELQRLSDIYDVPLVVEVNEFWDVLALYELGSPKRLDINAMMVAIHTQEEIEGWVIQFTNGDMVKLKTKWYMDRHHAMTFLRIRDIARMVIDETLDDLKAKLVGDGIDITPILDIELKVVQEIDYIIERVELAFNANKDKSRKDFAILMQGHKYFGLLMQKFSGKEPDYKGFFAKHHLDEMFSLAQINLTDSVAEVE